MTLPVTYSAAEVAEALGRDRVWLVERANQRPDLWPSLKVGKQVRFTQAQVDEILARCTRAGDELPQRELTVFGRPVKRPRRSA